MPENPQQTDSTPYEEIDRMMRKRRIIDLSHRLQPGIPHFPTHSAFFQLPWSNINDPATMNVLLIHEHNGTHVDAPLHLISDKSIVDPNQHGMHNVDVRALMGPCCVIPVQQHAGGLISAADILRWEERFGAIQSESIVLFNTGWHHRWALGTDGDAYVSGWPGLDRSAADLLLARQVNAVGIDTLGLDCSGSTEVPAHDVLLVKGVLILENLANLDALPPRCFFMALPLPIVNGSGSPIRAIALV